MIRRFGALTLEDIKKCFTRKTGRKFLWMLLQNLFLTKKHEKIFGQQIKIADPVAFLWQYKEIFIDRKFDVINSDDPIIFDCGANIGLVSFYLKNKHPAAQIVAFEPNPEICKIARKNLTAVDLHETALFDQSGQGSLNMKSDDGSSLDDFGNPVYMERLCSYLKKYDHINLLKLDVEGSELNIIKDIESQLHKIDFLFIEIHKTKDLAPILSLLNRFDFEIFKRDYVEIIAKRNKYIQ